MLSGLNQRHADMDKSCLSWWFPKIMDAGLPVPKTTILRCDSEAAPSLYRHFDNQPVGVKGSDFLGQVEAAVREMCLPCFLRTGQTSGKHSWKRTCHIQDVSDVVQHVVDLIEFSECADFFGLPWGVWAVREMLPTKPVMAAYEGMPVCREFRVFVDDGLILCKHPYWPIAALQGGSPRDWDTDELLTEEDVENRGHALWELDDADCKLVLDLASRAGAACGGLWSVDILDTELGWFVTDMAVMDLSWHWPGCPNAGGLSQV